MSDAVRRRWPPLDRLLRRPAAAVVAGFAMAVAVGTVLLMLPVAVEGGGATGFVAAVFTAVSAVCVTGLIVVDTPTYWSTFGELVILVLIQVGGLGIMTLATLLGLLIARRISSRLQLTAQAETQSLGLGDVRQVVGGVLAISLSVELVVAVPLVTRFALFYDEPLGSALYLGGFHAVSGFNNAGFSLFTDSMMPFATDAWIIMPIGLPPLSAGSGYRCYSSWAGGYGAVHRGGSCTHGSRWAPMRSSWWWASRRS